jgi:hypothetical protein
VAYDSSYKELGNKTFVSSQSMAVTEKGVYVAEFRGSKLGVYVCKLDDVSETNYVKYTNPWQVLAHKGMVLVLEISPFAIHFLNESNMKEARNLEFGVKCTRMAI